MLTLEPKAWYSWDFRVLDGDEEIAFLDRSWVRERLEFTLDGESFAVRRTSVVRGTFVLEREGEVLAEAGKKSVFRRAFDLAVGPERWVLEAVSPLRREFRLLRGGLELGSVRPVSILRRRAMIDLPEAVPIPLQVFVSCLVLVLWKRSADAASGS
jgi:hypothetical protein